MPAPDANVPALVRFDKISKLYLMGDAEVHALREIDFEVLTGEFVAVMGASGSGKSTMLNVLGTLDRPTSGSYFLDGEPIESLDEYELSALRNRKFGFVFQSPNLLPRRLLPRNRRLRSPSRHPKKATPPTPPRNPKTSPRAGRAS